ncbi:MAG: hypothetical protein M1120_00660 [Patescibacteria group bacterium]|nr:hypothetical protein [Patescibacteria group bacterium]
MAGKEVVQAQYLDSLGEKLSFKGLSAWFDLDGVLFKKTADHLWDYFTAVFDLSLDERASIGPYYLNPGNWKGWDGKKVTPQIIERLTTKSIFEVLGFDEEQINGNKHIRKDSAVTKLEMLQKVFSLKEKEVNKIKSEYLNCPQNWPGWKRKKLSPAVINNLVRHFFSTPGLHFMIDADEDAQGVLERLSGQGLDINYFTTRRGDLSLHNETIEAIEKAGFINRQGNVYSMAWDQDKGATSPLENSTVWKTTKPALVNKANGNGDKEIVIIDDDYRVCQAAAEGGLWSILVEAPYNHPKAPDMQVENYHPYGKIYYHKGTPGMLRISSLKELPFAFHLIHEYVLAGKREEKWLTGNNV